MSSCSYFSDDASLYVPSSCHLHKYLLVVVDEVRVRHVDDLLRIEPPVLLGDERLVGDHVLDVVRAKSPAEAQVRHLKKWKNKPTFVLIISTFFQTSQNLRVRNATPAVWDTFYTAREGVPSVTARAAPPHTALRFPLPANLAAKRPLTCTGAGCRAKISFRAPLV